MRQDFAGSVPHVGIGSGRSGVCVALGVGVGAGIEQIRSRSVVAGQVGIAALVGRGGSSVGVGDGAVFVAIAWSNPGGGVGVVVVAQLSAALGVKPVEDVDDSPTAATKRASAATSAPVARIALIQMGAP